MNAPHHLAAWSPNTPQAPGADQRALRFLTAGSVDDGKSTLIGRLLFDAQAILADQLGALEQRAAGAPIDLSLLTDGLEAEREQGITIDVAYRYFATRQRKFIMADAPGHEQYTRNMVTAAAGSDAAVVLVDITKLDLTQTQPALLPQTRRHALLAHLLRLPSIVFAVNKVDAVAEPGLAFERVSASLRAFAAEAGITVTAILPVSALRGDNVTTPLQVDWYQGPSLLALLHQLPTAAENAQAPLHLPLQYVARDAGEAGAASGVGHQPRTLWGRVAQGTVRLGDELQLLPSGVRAKVQGLLRAGQEVTEITEGWSAGVILDRQVDASRGDVLVPAGGAPVSRHFTATLAWLDTEPAQMGRKYWLRHGHRWVQGRITGIDHCLNIHTLAQESAHALAVNDIGVVQIEVQTDLPLTPYADNRTAGALILVDPTTNRTSGALMVHAA